MDLLAGDAGNGWSVWPCALPACAELRLWRASRPGCETRRRWWRGRWCECAAIAWRLRRPVPMKECACGSTRRLELRAPDPRQRASPFGIPFFCFRRSVQATRAGGRWGFTSAPIPDGPPPDRPSRSPAKGGAVRHSGRELPPRFTASGCFPSSQPGGRTAPPIPNARPLPRTQEGCASRASGFLAVGTGITCASRPGVNTP